MSSNDMNMNKQPMEEHKTPPPPPPPPRRAGSFPSPSSSPSSDFEFIVSLSPSSRRSSTNLCPADELFYKGQLLPLHLSPRISMVRTLLLASSSTSSSSTVGTATTASRDSSSSTSSSSSGVVPSDLLHLPECDSSRPSSVTEDDIRFKATTSGSSATKRNKYFSSFANRFSSVFLNRSGSKKDASAGIEHLDHQMPMPSAKPTARQVISKYVRKVKPLYERLSPKNQSPTQINNQKKKTFSFSIRRQRDIALSTACTGIVEAMKKLDEDGVDGIRTSATSYHHHSHSHSFSGNLRFPRRRRCAGSCPSSPTHSGLLRIGGGDNGPPKPPSMSPSSMEELQSAIQGAIAHCKSTMIQSHLKKSSTNVISVN